jgi:hypothetical protein
LYALARRPDIQERLRAEMTSFSLPSDVSGNAPLTSEQVTALERLPLLDAVVRETLRMHTPGQATMRMAMRDTSVPVAKPFIDSKGNIRDHFMMRKGDLIYLPHYLINRTSELYGEDAGEWQYVHVLFHMSLLTKVVQSGALDGQSPTARRC